MSEREFTPTPLDERDEVARLKAQLAKAEIAANEAEAFGKFDVTAPNVSEQTYESYLAQRPEDGIMRDGESFRDNISGQFASAEAYGSDKTPQSTADYYHNLMESDSKPYEEKDFKSLGLKQLVFEMAKAENLGDKALSLEVQDAMGSRLTELAEKEGWTSKQKDEQAGILLNQVLVMSGQAETEATPAIDAKVDSENIPVVTNEDEAVIRSNPEPAIEGESAEEYATRQAAAHEALNKAVKVDTLGDAVISPVPVKIDTLEGLVVSPLPSEQTPEDDSNAKASEQENASEAGEDDKLDEEKQSIWEKARDRYDALSMKAFATFRTTLFMTGNFMPKPKQRLEKGETDEQFESRVRRIGAAKLVGAVALIVAAAAAVKYGLPSLEGGDAHVSPKTSAGLGHGVHDVLATGLPGSEFSHSAHTVTRGEGWYQTLKEMGITNETDQANRLVKVGPALQKLGWAYPRGNSWGISHTGQLPENVLKLIKNSR